MTTTESDGAMTAAVFKDTSTECAICLSSFLEDDDDENSGAEIIMLTCGHRFHFDCLKEQLEHAQPNHSRRLLFGGCRCAKCGVFCDHPAFKDLTRKTDNLRTKVDVLIQEQLQIDHPNEWRETSHDNNKSLLLERGRRTYAFYLCNSCQGPYFGGSVECADQEEGELPSQDRLCPSCSEQTQTHCQHSEEHRGFHVWKCRYCCSPSSHVCYGKVHFCESCHDRNSQRVRQQQQQQQQRRGTAGPPPLEAIPCKGSDCPYPKPVGQDNHYNGPSPSCEQVYHCAWCMSSQSRQSLTPTIEPGSRNLLINPSGEQGLQGWQQFNPRLSWKVEASDIPVNGTTRTNFVSGFQWCIMAQRVTLHRFVTDPSSVRVEVSAKFMGRTDCPSVFRMEAIVLNSGSEQIHRANIGPLDAPSDFWERASLIVDSIPNAHEIIMVVYGKDSRFWQGDFGCKVAECSVRVLCSEDEWETVLRTGEQSINQSEKDRM
jgi:hypothetical protein